MDVGVSIELAAVEGHVEVDGEPRVLRLVRLAGEADEGAAVVAGTCIRRDGANAEYVRAGMIVRMLSR